MASVPFSRAHGASGNSGTFDPLSGFDPLASRRAGGSVRAHHSGPTLSQAEEHTLLHHPELWLRDAGVPVTQPQLRAWLASAGSDLQVRRRSRGSLDTHRGDARLSERTA